MEQRKFSMRNFPLKPPKMRFKIGEFIKVQGTLYEIAGAYRLVEDPHEWIYVLRDLTKLSNQTLVSVVFDIIEAKLSQPFDVIPKTPFRTSYDAVNHFNFPPRIGRRGDVCHMRNKRLISEGSALSADDEIEAFGRALPPCKNPGCGSSSGIIDEEPTFGSGNLDPNGYWEFPCKICAEAFFASRKKEAESKSLPG